jgi:Fuc2NAc and GlcNAc transferase
MKIFPYYLCLSEMLSTYPVLIFLIAAVVSWCMTGILIPFLEKSFIDTPNLRSSHHRPTPRGGGLAFVLTGSLLHLYVVTGPTKWIPIICLPLAFVSFFDDFKSLPAVARYLVQLGTAFGIVVWSGHSISMMAATIFLVIVITAIINFTNFMDGLDGLVAGCGVLLMAATSSWAISGAIFGFLIWNWSPAKVFMGDVGSTFIGAVFAGMLLQRESSLEIFYTMLIGFPLLADSFVTLIRRLINRENIFKPHRKHLFQRLHQSGWAHKRVALLYISGVAVLLSVNTFFNIFVVILAILCELLIAIYLEMKVAIRF